MKFKPVTINGVKYLPIKAKVDNDGALCRGCAFDGGRTGWPTWKRPANSTACAT